MKKKQYLFYLLFFYFLVFNVTNFAYSDDEDNLEELKKEIKILKNRIATLENSKNTSTPSPNIDQWDPFAEISRMHEQMDKMFKSSFNLGGSSSKGMLINNMSYNDTFNITEEKDKYIIEFDISGLDKNNITLEINDKSLTISGETSNTSQKNQNNRYVSFNNYSKFLRSIPIPTDADVTNINSKQKDNKLIITIGKK